MTHSTLTWFSYLYKPQHNELFVVAVKQGNGSLMVFHHLYRYDIEEDRFNAATVFDMPAGIRSMKRTQIAFWAYVPVEVDEHLKLDAVSQVPNQ